MMDDDDYDENYDEEEVEDGKHDKDKDLSQLLPEGISLPQAKDEEEDADDDDEGTEDEADMDDDDVFDKELEEALEDDEEEGAFRQPRAPAVPMGVKLPTLGRLEGQGAILHITEVFFSDLAQSSVIPPRRQSPSREEKLQRRRKKLAKATALLAAGKVVEGTADETAALRYVPSSLGPPRAGGSGPPQPAATGGDDGAAADASVDAGAPADAAAEPGKSPATAKKLGAAPALSVAGFEPVVPPPLAAEAAASVVDGHLPSPTGRATAAEKLRSAGAAAARQRPGDLSSRRQQREGQTVAEAEVLPLQQDLADLVLETREEDLTALRMLECPGAAEAPAAHSPGEGGAPQSFAAPGSPALLDDDWQVALEWGSDDGSGEARYPADGLPPLWVGRGCCNPTEEQESDDDVTAGVQATSQPPQAAACRSGGGATVQLPAEPAEGAEKVQPLLGAGGAEELDDSWVEGIVWDSEDGTGGSAQAAEGGAAPGSAVVWDMNDATMVFQAASAGKKKDLSERAAAVVLGPPAKMDIVMAPLPREQLGELGEHEEALAAELMRYNMSNDNFYHSAARDKGTRGVPGFPFKMRHAVPAQALDTLPLNLAWYDRLSFHRPRWLLHPAPAAAAAAAEGDSASKPAADAGAVVPVHCMALSGQSLRMKAGASSTLQALWDLLCCDKKFKEVQELQPQFIGGQPMRCVPMESNVSELNLTPTNNTIYLTFQTVKLLPTRLAEAVPEHEADLRPPKAFRTKPSLAASDGHVILIEYMEERPPLLPRPGMGLSIITHYRKSSPTDPHRPDSIFEDEVDDSMRRWMVGASNAIGPDEDSPFLGNIPPGAEQLGIGCQLFTAPAGAHFPARSDFLLIRRPSGAWVLREATGCLAAGQQQAYLASMEPGSKEVTSYLERRMEVQIWRDLRSILKKLERRGRAGEQPSVAVPHLCSLFQDHAWNPAQVKARLKEMRLEPQGEGEQYVLPKAVVPPDESELRKLCTPETCCLFESALAAITHLEQLGMSQWQQLLPFAQQGSEKLNVALDLLPLQPQHIRKAAALLFTALCTLPWLLTENCRQVSQMLYGTREAKARLSITGLGDPTGRKMGYAFTKDLRRSELAEKQVIPKHDSGSISGTTADLRRKPVVELKRILQDDFGVPMKELQGLTRWRLVDLLRELANDAIQAGGALATTAMKYARFMRASPEEHLKKLKEDAQAVYQAQVALLKTSWDDEDAPAGAPAASGTQAPAVEVPEELQDILDGPPAPNLSAEADGSRVQAEDEERAMHELREMVGGQKKSSASGKKDSSSGGGGSGKAGGGAGGGSKPGSASLRIGDQRVRVLVTRRAADGSTQQHHIMYTDKPRIDAALALADQRRKAQAHINRQRNRHRMEAAAAAAAAEGRQEQAAPAAGGGGSGRGSGRRDRSSQGKSGSRSGGKRSQATPSAISGAASMAAAEAMGIFGDVTVSGPRKRSKSLRYTGVDVELSPDGNEDEDEGMEEADGALNGAAVGDADWADDMEPEWDQGALEMEEDSDTDGGGGGAGAGAGAGRHRQQRSGRTPSSRTASAKAAGTRRGAQSGQDPAEGTRRQSNRKSRTALDVSALMRDEESDVETQSAEVTLSDDDDDIDDAVEQVQQLSRAVSSGRASARAAAAASSGRPVGHAAAAAAATPATAGPAAGTAAAAAPSTSGRRSQTGGRSGDAPAAATPSSGRGAAGRGQVAAASAAASAATPAAAAPPPVPVLPAWNGHPALKSVLSNVLSLAMLENNYFSAFKLKVSKSTVPDYNQYVPASEEMFTELIKRRINSMKYNSGEDMMVDVRQIVTNACRYNDPDTGGKVKYPPIIETAKALQQAVESRLAEPNTLAQLRRAEAEIAEEAMVKLYVSSLEAGLEVQWAACDECEKWRVVSHQYLGQVGDRWYCKLQQVERPNAACFQREDTEVLQQLGFQV